MTTIIGGSSPSITFSDNSTQTTAFLNTASQLVTGTLPLAQGGSGTTIGQAIIPLSTVSPSGTSSFGFSVTAYAQYIVFYKNISSSSGGTVMSMKCSTNGGSSFVSNINTRNTQFNVDNTTTSSSVTSVGSGYIWNEVWNSTSNGTNGVIGIAGTSYGGVNRLLSWWAIGAGQTPPN